MSVFTNQNSLKGVKCPQCSSLGPFKIAITALATVSDDGVECTENPDWSDNDYCECCSCGASATVGDFKQEEA